MTRNGNPPRPAGLPPGLTPYASNRTNIQIGPPPESRQRPDLHLAQG